MNTDIDFKRGVLFVRVNGNLVGKKVKQFEESVLPIILGLEARKVTLNLEKVNLIDSIGISSIINLSAIISTWDGKLVLCEINDSIKTSFINSDIYDYCFKTKNELTSLGVFAI